ncbi:MAG: O-antigen ligase family protein [Candidatus Sericytochromatia bacterium]|nr:O-antigen ligase family protein [Candidatus Sericytochromatia bacterium]
MRQTALPTARPTPGLVLLAWWALGALATAGVVAAVGTLDRLAMIALATVPAAVLVVLHPLVGVACLLAYATVLGFLIRLLPPGAGSPIGLALDVLLALMAARLAVDLVRHGDPGRLASPLTPAVACFAGYTALEVLNPAAPSLLHGLVGLRVTARVLGFFLVLYYVRDRRAVGWLAGTWLAVVLATGAYGIFQHHHGLLWHEMAWLLTEGNAQTHIIGGHLRVFSTMGDAATFGFLMMAGTLQAVAWAQTAAPPWRWALWLAVLPLLYAMALSYTRGPVVALVAGFAALVAASRSWRLAAGASVLAALGLALLLGTGSTRLVERLATAALPGQDASFNVRVGYVTQYLPEIARRPFGYGVNTSGGGARKLAGGNQMRGTVVGVPTDNYHFKVALELGWVGLGLWAWLVVTLMVQAWRACASHRGDALALGLCGTLVALVVGAFSNDIIAQKPVAELFWVAAGLVALLARQGRRTGATPALGGEPR